MIVIFFGCIFVLIIGSLFISSLVQTCYIVDELFFIMSINHYCQQFFKPLLAFSNFKQMYKKCGDNIKILSQKIVKKKKKKMINTMKKFFIQYIWFVIIDWCFYSSFASNEYKLTRITSNLHLSLKQ